MKIWLGLDAPSNEGYFQCDDYPMAKRVIMGQEGEDEIYNGEGIEYICVSEPDNNTIELLLWLERTKREYKIIYRS